MANRHLILPPHYEPLDGPLVFLAGPVQGAPNWQAKAQEYLWANRPAINIASPRRECDLSLDVQADWETHHLELALVHGVILFWLANEEKHDCSRAYAQTSRFELGKWTALREQDDSIKLVIGIDSAFPGARYIAHQVGRMNTVIPLTDNLDDVLNVTLAMLNGHAYNYKPYVMAKR